MKNIKTFQVFNAVMAFTRSSFIRSKLLLLLLMVFVIFIALSHSCSVNTFNNTSVTVGGVKGIKVINGCFSPSETLLKASYIQIINESIPIIRRDAITGLAHLVDIILENNGITYIEPGAFYNLPSLYLLKIKHNNFKSILEGVFNGLHLTELCLTNNSIEYIHENAFNHLPKLSILFLNENKITSWKSDWFLYSPKVSVLNFEYNLLSTIPTRALKNVKGVHFAENAKINVSTNVLLNNNKIQYLEDYAFDGIEILGWLFLHKNELREITDISLGSLRSADWVRLEYNNLACIPEKLVNISSKVVYYLGNNPLTQECKDKYKELK